jgi:hypothetical protein
VYAELSGLSKKAIDYAIKADMQQELLNIFKVFIYDVQSRLEPENLTDINNPVVTKHKGRPPKRLQANVEKDLHKERRVVKDSSNVSMREDHSALNNVEDSKSRKCSKCKQYGHYAKTCQNNV